MSKFSGEKPTRGKSWRVSGIDFLKIIHNWHSEALAMQSALSGLWIK